MEGDKLIIDCHSHILPRIDDGSQSVNESMDKRIPFRNNILHNGIVEYGI